jgi:hydroxymethylpyrimidine pyrophosphatase-like HAD family hydrolase
MGNAAPAAAAAADDRCPPVSEDGVAVYLEALFGF